MIVTRMRLKEEISLRRMIRGIINETLKMNKGWEGYEQGLNADNDEIDVGYDAAYYEQYADAVLGLDRTAELDAGGENVITRRRKARRK